MIQVKEILEVTSPSGYVVKVGSLWNYNRSLDNSPCTRNLKVNRIWQRPGITSTSDKATLNYSIEFEQFMPYQTYGLNYFDGTVFSPAEQFKVCISELTSLSEDWLKVHMPSGDVLTYLKRPAVLRLMSDFVKQLIENKYLIVAPGHEDYFKTLDLNEPTTNGPVDVGEWLHD